MMRRCLWRCSAVPVSGLSGLTPATWGKSKPIFEVLSLHAASAPKDMGEWGHEVALLHKHHVTTADCWAQLSPREKEALAEAGLGTDIIRALDVAVGEGLGEGGVRKMLILFGSQTGTAESYARMLGTQAASHGFVPIVCNMNDGMAILDNASVPLASVVFVLSTYGTGEFPTNAEQFWHNLEANKPEWVGRVKYAVMGLGNSTNDNFNAAAKKLSRRLQEVGGTSMLRMHLSCELQPNGHDAVFRTFKRNLWTALGTAQVSNLSTTYAVTPVMTAKPDEHIVPLGFIPTTIRKNLLMTPKDYPARTRLLTFNVDMARQIDMLKRRFVITDQVMIVPRNGAALVQRAVKRLGVKESQTVEITPLSGAPHSVFDGHKMTIRTLLSEVVDLSAIPSRSFLEALSTIATDADSKAGLEELANDLGAHSKYDELIRGVFSIMDALEMFPKLNVTLDQLLTHAPHIAPRTYSLARDNTDWISEEFEVLYTVPTRHAATREHTGLCTNMLEEVGIGNEIFVRFAPSGIPLPKVDAPLCLFALGSGIGAARALLQSRKIAKKHGAEVAKTVLYYGFRHVGKDQFFLDELKDMEKDGLLDMRCVASHDQPEFRTPMDVVDSTLVDFLGARGEVYYCGLGGSAPLVVESALRRVGVDVAELRTSGRYHEEYFTADLDTENLLKAHTSAEANAKTLAGRMGQTEMFCFQCEQTFKGTGCTKTGVCGKTPRVAALQDLTIHATKILGWYANAVRKANQPVSDAVNRMTLFTLFSTLTNVNFDEERFVKIVHDLQQAINQVAAQYEKLEGGKESVPRAFMLPKTLPAVDGLVDLGRKVGVLTRFTDPATQNAAGVAEMLMYGLKGIAAYADHSLMNNLENADIYVFLHEALAFLLSPESGDLNKGLALCLQAGKINVATMSLLYQSNSTLGTPSPATVANKPTPGKCILVSGHDLIILRELLKKTEPLGIKVYTHGEMLPAHGYPQLRQYKSLVGNFGGAWMRQAVEFPSFPGPILMTTNCLTEPHESYRGRIFTAGAVGWSGVPHLGDDLRTIQFDSLIAAAQKAPGFTAEDTTFKYADPVGQRRAQEYQVGFGHDAIIQNAGTILEEVKKGNITRFVVVGGCDGYEGQRSYYTDLVSRLPKTAVVLTMGCAKYRMNHLELGTIGETGIPRLLDLGQCNDSFSAVQVALALSKALNCSLADLPLTIVLSWFEQKAVAVLLSCLSLGLKPIHVGPKLPAFVTPDVLQVLVKDFGVCPIGDVEKDVKTMVAAAGAS